MVLIGVWGLVVLAVTDNARQTEARLHLAIFTVVLLVGAGLSFDGGWRVGPRYMVITLPGLMLGLSHDFRKLRENPIALGVFATLATWSVLVNTLAGTLWPHIDPTYINSPIGEVLLPLLDDGYAPYGIPWWLGLPGSAWLPILAALVGLGWFLYRGIEGTRPRMVGAVVGILIGLVAVWMTPSLFEEHPKGKRNLKYIERVYEPRLESYEPAESHRLDVPVAQIGS